MRKIRIIPRPLSPGEQSNLVRLAALERARQAKKRPATNDRTIVVIKPNKSVLEGLTWAKDNDI